MNETTVTVVGNLVDDPRLRQTENGVVVANFRVASTSRRYDRDSGRWIDAGSLFLNVTCWRALGDNVAASLHKGDPVLVAGRLFTRTYQRDGQVRSSYDVDATAVGPDLARGTAVFQRHLRPVVPPTFTVDEPGGPIEETSDELSGAAEGLPTAAGGLADGGLADGGLADGGLADGGLADGGLADGGPADELDDTVELTLAR